MIDVRLSHCDSDLVASSAFPIHLSLQLTFFTSTSKQPSWLSSYRATGKLALNHLPVTPSNLSSDYYGNCSYSNWDIWGRWVAFAVIVGVAFLIFFSFA